MGGTPEALINYGMILIGRIVIEDVNRAHYSIK
jgi:hypothetical protein